jgi:hydrogenase expression/formation protein HypC
MIEMCIGIPALIISREGDSADVEMGGAIRKANVQLVPDAKVGDYVLLHAGFAIQKLDEKDALETLRLLEELYEIQR